MIRILRFSSIFRVIIKRSDEVLPAIFGPLALVLSSMHFYVYAGMAIWGGAVAIGMHNDRIQPLYDLNNFNDYGSGLLTMFNIFVVNDWQTIAGVYLMADCFSSPFIVYPFFISANLIGVNILLNVLTAFFVGAFVTTVEDKQKVGERRGLHLTMPSRMNASFSNLSNNDESALLGFHILERQGYDRVMSAITGDEPSELAKKVCRLLDTFELVSPSDNEGFLICCKDFFSGNEKFFSSIRGYIEEDELHDVANNFFSRLMTKDVPRVQEEYESINIQENLLLAASICVESPMIALIIARKM